MSVPIVFKQSVEAMRKGVLIQRVSRQDKEFHFQNWFEARLRETGLNFERGGRNSYPDFRMVTTTEGYEVKGLAYPGREASFDSNSQVPSGLHNGRTIFYVFGRYPADVDGDTYPVLDLVVCHGDFLNADHEYVHENKSIKGFASYGDMMIRDRKMYVVPTPYNITDGVAHHQTLILPSSTNPGDDYFEVGELSRRETDELVIGYSFNLQNNEMQLKRFPNPSKGKEHKFRAWRLKGSTKTRVQIRQPSATDENPSLEVGNYHDS